MTKRAAIYDPYLDTLGGGERYCLTVAETLLENGFTVDLFWNGTKDIITKAQDRFSLNLSQINLLPDCFNIKPHNLDEVIDVPKDYIYSKIPKNSPFQKYTNLINKIKISSSYDLFFFLSDGSIPLLLSKKNLLHVQVPFTAPKSPNSGLFNTLKLLKINKIITNSQFTNRFTQKFYGRPGIVLYPPVDISKFSSGVKENVILSVGRFDNILNAKRQDILIENFSQIHQHNPNWKLVLAGGSILDPDNNNYLHHLKHISQNLPVEFYVNPKFDELCSLYSTARIYWHAAGFEVDENLHPENTEHFGITIVEAMSAGLVPVAVNKGGIPEIITDGTDGYLWNSPKDLVAKTLLLIDTPSLMSQISQSALTTASKFSKENFKTNFLSIINS